MTVMTLTIAQASANSGVSTDYIRSMCKATEVHGGIKARKVAGKWLIKPEDLAAWLNSHPTESEQAAS